MATASTAEASAGSVEGARLRVRPHGLRHTAITEPLGLGAQVRAARRPSRHRDLLTLPKHDGNRQDLGGDVARRVAEGGRPVA